MIRKLLIAALLCAAFSSSGLAAYRFLGNLESTERVDSGLLLTCEDGNALRVLLPEAGLVRFTLMRADREADPLDYTLAGGAFPPVEFQLEEAVDHLLLTTAELVIRIGRSPCRITILDHEQNVLCEQDPGLGIGWDGNEVRCWLTADHRDRYFGLGSKTGNLNRMGSEFVLWNRDFPDYDNRSDPLYQSIPFYLQLRNGIASGVLFNNSYRTHFNFRAGNLRYSSFRGDGGDLDYFYLHGPKIDDVVKRYARLTGMTPMPPLWALGYQQCRWSYYPESEVRALAQTFREKRIPADVIYLDIHYMDDYRVFTWDEERFPHPKKMLADLEADGFKVVTIIDPGVKADPDYAVAASGVAGNHFVRYPDSTLFVGEVWPGPSYFPDFSAPLTREWWGDWVSDWLDGGVDGCWIDMNEPAVWGQSFPLETVFNDEGRIAEHKKLHNLYGALMAKATYEGSLMHDANERPFVVTRAGFAGEQRYTAVWTGDNAATDEQLALGIRMVLGLSLSGIPFCGTDVGGFIGTPTPELYARWIQVGALTPFFRTHTHYGSPDQEPWSFGEEVEAISRDFISLRYSLLPYFYSLFRESNQTGAPILRPLFYHDQADDRAHWDLYQHQFFVGDGLLAAPVVRQGHYQQRVYLPQGKWLNMHDETVYEGPREIVVEAPWDRLPMFLREGTILPTRDPQQYTSEEPLSALYVDVFPSDSQSSFVLYEDDGHSLDYLKGKFMETEWVCADRDSVIEFSQQRLHEGFRIPPRNLKLRVHDLDYAPEIEVAPIDSSSAVWGGKAPAVFYDARKRIASISFESDPGDCRLLLRKKVSR